MAEERFIATSCRMAGWIKVVFTAEPAHFIKERLLGKDAKPLREAN